MRGSLQLSVVSLLPQGRRLRVCPTARLSAAQEVSAERGDQAVGLIRSPAHVADVQKAGAEAVICDLEAASDGDVAELLSGAEVVVFAAGAGAGSGAPRKDSVDRAASVLMADAAERAGVRRFVQVSSMGAGRPPRPGTGEVWAAYITAKTAALYHASS